MRDEILYTPDEIAKKLKLSKYTVYEMIKRNEIPAHRIGRSLRITESQLATYLSQSKQPDNSFEAEIVQIDDETFAKIPGTSSAVNLSVVTQSRGPAMVSIKSEDIILSRTRVVCSAENNIPGTITGMEENGNTYKIVVNVGIPLIVSLTKRSVAELSFKLGDSVHCIFKALAVTVV